MFCWLINSSKSIMETDSFSSSCVLFEFEKLLDTLCSRMDTWSSDDVDDSEENEEVE